MHCEETLVLVRKDNIEHNRSVMGEGKVVSFGKRLYLGLVVKILEKL